MSTKSSDQMAGDSLDDDFDDKREPTTAVLYCAPPEIQGLCVQTEFFSLSNALCSLDSLPSPFLAPNFQGCNLQSRTIYSPSKRCTAQWKVSRNFSEKEEAALILYFSHCAGLENLPLATRSWFLKAAVRQPWHFDRLLHDTTWPTDGRQPGSNGRHAGGEKKRWFLWKMIFAKG